MSETIARRGSSYV